jgi:5-methyltetrahydropteroyltriglutamate--homocysteine methyltransferase
MLFPTTLVGSYPQPGWLMDKSRLGIPRVPSPDLWRVAPDVLEEAQNDAVRLALADQIRCGIDIVTDGEMRRESYSNRFAAALSGIDLENVGSIQGGGSEPIVVPRVVGPIARTGPVEVSDVEFLRPLTELPIKVTLPGPFTMSQQAENQYYHDERKMALDYAVAVHDEAMALFAAGADVVQIDEPWMRRAEQARVYGAEAFERAVSGLPGTTAVHLCFGYGPIGAARPNRLTSYPFLEELADTSVDQISIETAQSHLDCSVLERLGDKTVILGVIDLSTNEVETPDLVVTRVERALSYIGPERLILSPDCGMKFLTREAAIGKLQSLAEAAAILRGRYA